MFIISAYEGQTVEVADRHFTVGTMRSPGVVEVYVEGESSPVLVSWDRKLELFPGVQVSMERNLGFSHRVKFLFDAPRSVRIRERPYDRET